jgi:hypothetical protein
MNRECPHCQKHVSWWRPLLMPRDRTIATVAVTCTFCGGLLRTNPHPTEEILIATTELMIGVPTLFGWLIGGMAGAVITAVFAIAIVAAGYMWFVVRTRDWHRYVPFAKVER